MGQDCVALQPSKPHKTENNPIKQKIVKGLPLLQLKRRNTTCNQHVSIVNRRNIYSRPTYISQNKKKYYHNVGLCPWIPELSVIKLLYLSNKGDINMDQLKTSDVYGSSYSKTSISPTYSIFHVVIVSIVNKPKCSCK